MGNQREIRQIEPCSRLGVCIPVSEGKAGVVRSIVDSHSIGHFYSYLYDVGAEQSIPNMDGADSDLGVLVNPAFVIQSGGKMWCGYPSFTQHITEVSPYLSDATFLVGDEEDYIDEFEIRSGSLKVTRLVSGFWMSVEDYIADYYPKRLVGD